jgi:hypothetical protein
MCDSLVASVAREIDDFDSKAERGTDVATRKRTDAETDKGDGRIYGEAWCAARGEEKGELMMSKGARKKRW